MKVSRGSLTMTVALALSLVGNFPCGASVTKKSSGSKVPTTSSPLRAQKSSRAPRVSSARKSSSTRNDHYTVKDFINSAKAFGPDTAHASRLAGISAYTHVKIVYVTPDDLKFGEEQIVTMLRDRPAMAKFVKKGDSIWNWTVRQFAGEGLGKRISWNGKPPGDDFLGNNSCDDQGREICVLEVLRGQHVPGEMQWSVAVFELHNIRGHSRFNGFHDEALAGQLTRKEYIRKMTEQEFIAMHQQRAFYKSVWLPHARLNKLAHTPYYWKIDEPNNYQQWIAQYASDPHYPEVYGKFFDKSITPYVKANSDEFTIAAAQVRADRKLSDADYKKLDKLAGSMGLESENLDTMGRNPYAPTESNRIRWMGTSGTGWMDSNGSGRNANGSDSKGSDSNVLEAGSNWMDANSTDSQDVEKPRSNPYNELLVLNKGIVEVQKTKEIESIEGQGRSLYLSGKFKEAAPFYERATEIRLHDVGSAHLDYATAITNLALIYCQLKRYDDAERLYKQALDIREHADHDRDEVKVTLKHLIALYQAKGKTAEVASLQKRIKMIEDMEELNATDDDGVSTDTVEWMKAPFSN